MHFTHGLEKCISHMDLKNAFHKGSKKDQVKKTEHLFYIIWWNDCSRNSAVHKILQAWPSNIYLNALNNLQETCYSKATLTHHLSYTLVKCINQDQISNWNKQKTSAKLKTLFLMLLWESNLRHFFHSW